MKTKELLKLKITFQHLPGETKIAGIPVRYKINHIIGSINEHDTSLKFAIGRDKFLLEFYETLDKTTVNKFVGSNSIDYAKDDGINFSALLQTYPMFMGGLAYYLPSGFLREIIKNAIYQVAKDYDITYKNNTLSKSNIQLDSYLFDADSIISGPGFSIELDEGFYICKTCLKTDYNPYLDLNSSVVEQCSECKFWQKAWK